MTERREANTAYGDVEYETVTCDSCGNEVVKDGVERFIVGDVFKTETRSLLNQKRFVFKQGEYLKGWACPSCRENGVSGFPQPTPSFLERLKWLFTGREP